MPDGRGAENHETCIGKSREFVWLEGGTRILAGKKLACPGLSLINDVLLKVF